jgi:hypothetical protein
MATSVATCEFGDVGPLPPMRTVNVKEAKTQSSRLIDPGGSLGCCGGNGSFPPLRCFWPLCPPKSSPTLAPR